MILSVLSVPAKNLKVNKAHKVIQHIYSDKVTPNIPPAQCFLCFVFFCFCIIVRCVMLQNPAPRK